MKKEGKLSIIVPCYNEEAVLANFYKEIMMVLREQIQIEEFEVLFIDDGSKDQTKNIIEGLSNQDSNVEFLSFSRNFGKESAMYAGLQYADGDYIVIMDADLQHPPCYIGKMYQDRKSTRLNSSHS